MMAQCMDATQVGHPISFIARRSGIAATSSNLGASENSAAVDALSV